MYGNIGTPNRRTVIASIIGAATALAGFPATAGRAEAATASRRCGPAVVLDVLPRRRLVVKVRRSGSRLNVRARDFGSERLQKGDLVAVAPAHFGDFTHSQLVARPYFEVDRDGAVWAFNTSGQASYIGTKSAAAAV